MRQLLLFLVFISGVLSCTSCRKDPPVGPSATFAVTIKTVYGDEPFIAGKEYDYPSEGSVRFDKLAIFLSDISLVVANTTDEVALDEVAYLDICAIQYDESTANKGWTQSYYKVPLGDYGGVNFGLGVAHENNSQGPENFSSGNPLGVTDHYSNQYFSYVFEDIGGQYYLGDDTVAFSIKVVQDKLFKQLSLGENFSIHDGSNEIEITFDLKKVFQDNDSIMNLTHFPMVVSPSLPQMDWLAKNLGQSFSL